MVAKIYIFPLCGRPRQESEPASTSSDSRGRSFYNFIVDLSREYHAGRISTEQAHALIEHWYCEFQNKKRIDDENI